MELGLIFFNFLFIFWERVFIQDGERKMKKIKASMLLFISLTISFSWAQGIRKPVWDGQFYEKNPERLRAQVSTFLQNAKTKPSLSGKIQALIVPHAGYVYSGQVAAFAYNQVLGKDFETVVIIGPSHHFGFEGCSIYDKGGFETPLGVAKVDEPFALALSKTSGFKYISQAHEKEHSVEVQVPFIQKVLPEAKIIPIVMGLPAEKTIRTLADALAKISSKKKILVIASTDMSHYLLKEEANSVDADTISLLQSLKINTLLRKVENGENILCGGGPVLSALLYAQKMGTPKVETLSYADSSEKTGETRAVGYLAAAICTEPPSLEFTLSKEEKTELLRLARLAITQYIKEKKVPEYEARNPNFLAPTGAFVTLNKKGVLRGCIGFPNPIYPLYQAVMRAAIYASSEDPRFPPVSLSELQTLDIEISVLTPLKKISDPKLVEVGRHGLVISRGTRTGLLLPQVAVENHWSRETFLKQACLKAGLEPDAWKQGADIFIFEAIVFH